MIYDAMIDTYTRHDDSHSSRVALLEKEISDLRISAKHLRERQGGGP